jgi:hypothetical protein
MVQVRILAAERQVRDGVKITAAPLTSTVAARGLPHQLGVRHGSRYVLFGAAHHADTRFLACGVLASAVTAPEEVGMRRAFLAVLGLDLVLVGANVVTYRPFFTQPGSVVYLSEPIVSLVVYAAVVLAATRSVNADQRRVLPTAALVGLATGALEIVNISVETFTGLSGAVNAPLILGPFVIWGVVGGWAAWATGALRVGMLGAVCSAMVTMVSG